MTDDQFTFFLQNQSLGSVYDTRSRWHNIVLPDIDIRGEEDTLYAETHVYSFYVNDVSRSERWRTEATSNNHTTRQPLPGKQRKQSVAIVMIEISNIRLGVMYSLLWSQIQNMRYDFYLFRLSLSQKKSFGLIIFLLLCPSSMCVILFQVRLQARNSHGWSLFSKDFIFRF